MGGYGWSATCGRRREQDHSGSIVARRSLVVGAAAAIAASSGRQRRPRRQGKARQGKAGQGVLVATPTPDNSDCLSLVPNSASSTRSIVRQQKTDYQVLVHEKQSGFRGSRGFRG